MDKYYKYIDENLKKIKSLKNVEIIKLVKDKKGLCFCARTCNSGVVQVNEMNGISAYPFDAINHLLRELFGKFNFENIAILGENVAINKDHLKTIGYIEKDKKSVQLYAVFEDGAPVNFANPKRRRFFKKWKPIIEEQCGMEFEDMLETTQEKGLNR